MADFDYIGKKPDEYVLSLQKVIDKNILLPDNKNSFSVGEVTINNDITVEVPENATFTVL